MQRPSHVKYTEVLNSYNITRLSRKEIKKCLIAAQSGIFPKFEDAIESINLLAKRPSYLPLSLLSRPGDPTLKDTD